MNTPTYYGIMPADVRYDSNLKPMEKILYSEITALSNMNGKCTAGNDYFSKLYGVSKSTVSRWFSNLKKQGYISITFTYKEDKSIDKRIVKISNSKINTPNQNDQQGDDKKVKTPHDKKVKDNNNPTDSLNNNPTDSNKKELSDLDRTLNEYYDMRIKNKSAMTDYAKKLNMNELERLAPNDDALKVKILEQSIVNSWKGVFPLREQGKKRFVQQSLFKNKPQLGVNKLTQEERDEMPF
jgi:DNA-binding transcriptional ArsR family regulator